MKRKVKVRPTMAELARTMTDMVLPTRGGQPLTEYTVEQLAIAAKTSVRNIRNYQEKGLLDPPRLKGRKGFYSNQHLARLKLIAGLIERGYTVNAIRELINGLEHGMGIEELIGVESAIVSPWTDEQPVMISMIELFGMFGPSLTPDAVRKAAELELFEVMGDKVRVRSMEVLKVGQQLTATGIPLMKLLDILERTRGNVQQVADDFVKLVTRQLLEPYGEDNLPPREEIPVLTDLVWQLRPLAERAVKAELARAMDKAANTFLVDKLASLVGAVQKAQRRKS